MKKYINLIVLLMFMFQAQNAEAKFDCGFLHPKLQEKDININGSLKAEAKGLMSKILGGKGSLNGKYFDQDSLVKYPDADKLARWYSIAYITCGMMNDDNISVDKKTEIYKELLNLYGVLSGVEEKLKIDKGIEDEFIPLAIDLSNISIGRRAKKFGKDIIVKEFRGKKYLAGKSNNGYFFQKIQNPSNNINISFTFKFHIENKSKRVITLKTNKNSKFSVKFDDEYIYFGGTKKEYRTSFKRWSYWHTPYAPNDLRFEIFKEEVILFVNDSLVGSIDKKPNVVVNAVSLSGLSDGDKLFSFTVSKQE